MDSKKEENPIVEQGKLNEEIKNQIKLIENRIISENNMFKSDIQSRLLQIESEINSKSYKNFQHSIINIDSYMNKIDTLSKSFAVLHEESMTQGLRIKNLDKSINERLYQYERLYLDNLQIPGLIGEYCKYKTFKDFIESIQSELDALNVYKEKQNLDLKQYKERLLTIISQFDTQVSQVERANKDYVNMKGEEYEKTLQREKSYLVEKIEENRLINIKYAKDLILTSDRLKIDIETMTKFKEEIKQGQNENLKQMIQVNDDTKQSFGLIYKDYQNMKKKFNYIVDFIKDVRFRRNLDADIRRGEVKDLAQRIEYNSKDKKMKSQSERAMIHIGEVVDESISISQLDEEKEQKEEKEEKAKSTKNVILTNNVFVKKEKKDRQITHKQQSKKRESLLRGYISGKTSVDEISNANKKKSDVQSSNNHQIESIDLKLNKILSSINEDKPQDDYEENDKKEKEIIRIISNKIELYDKRLLNIENIINKEHFNESQMKNITTQKQNTDGPSIKDDKSLLKTTKNSFFSVKNTFPNINHQEKIGNFTNFNKTSKAKQGTDIKFKSNFNLKKIDIYNEKLLINDKYADDTNTHFVDIVFKKKDNLIK